MAPPTLLPDSARAALDDAVQAVADAVRTSFTPREGSAVDPATGSSVANLAANRASKAAHAALSDALTAFVLSTNIDGSPISASSSASTSDTVLSSLTSSSTSTSAPVSSSTPPAPAVPPPTSSSPDPAVLLLPALEAILDPVRFPGTPQQPSRCPPAAPALGPDALAALHAQAVSVLNIKALVPITLDVATANFTRWRGLFLIALGKYALTAHVLSDERRPDLAEWIQMDCVVLGWLYGTISSDLLQEVMSHDATARSVWRALELQFLGYCEQRALNLTTEFRTFHQGDLSVNDYCRRMKTMADSLGDLGDPLTDRALVLATLNGLNEKFDTLRSLVTMQRPFPSFADVRSQLLLEELTKASRPSGQSTVLLAGASRGKPPSTPNPAHVTGYGAGASGGSGNSSNNKNRRRRGGGSGNSGGGTNTGGGGGGGNTPCGPKTPAQGCHAQKFTPNFQTILRKLDLH
ncbi:uncharacterized protein [Oryza sativa Japonica Group]|uniref:uncharacterized protein n=1 Tax=Oryza sativa subsp. japonica TaxID=39947 RepID=UPI00339CEB2E